MIPQTVPTPVQGVIVWVQDNDAVGAPDAYNYFLALEPPPCLVPGLAFIPVEKGDIEVVDAVP